jgi:hypothetical protein
MSYIEKRWEGGSLTFHRCLWKATHRRQENKTNDSKWCTDIGDTAHLPPLPMEGDAQEAGAPVILA